MSIELVLEDFLRNGSLRAQVSDKHRLLVLPLALGLSHQLISSIGHLLLICASNSG